MQKLVMIFSLSAFANLNIMYLMIFRGKMFIWDPVVIRLMMCPDPRSLSETCDM